jgi:hypothetical protein
MPTEDSGKIRENEYGTQELREKPLQINSPMRNREEKPTLTN